MKEVISKRFNGFIPIFHTDHEFMVCLSDTETMTLVINRDFTKILEKSNIQPRIFKDDEKDYGNFD